MDAASWPSMATPWPPPSTLRALASSAAASSYHRPRGLLCCSGNCPNCLVNVGDEPNVRACTRAVEPGLRVRSQNAWPSLGFDLLSLLDKLHWLMPVRLLLQGPAPPQGPLAAGAAAHLSRWRSGQNRHQRHPRDRIQQPQPPRRRCGGGRRTCRYGRGPGRRRNWV